MRVTIELKNWANMKAIKMVDLKRQYEHSKEDIDHAIAKVLEKTAFINGEEVQGFAENLAEYLQVRHVIPCASGTDALQIAMMALGFRPGDEVIVPVFTYVASVEILALLGLKPVLVDVKADNYNIDVDQIENLITPKTVAILPVHLYGQCAAMQPIMQLADKYGLHVIEDTAQALGASYTFADGTQKKAGTIGTIGTTSFFPSKNLGGYGDGGALFTNDDALAHKIRMVANHGQTTKYVHDLIGLNSRLDTLQAAILNVKLARLDAYNQRRNKAAHYYDKAFENETLLTLPQRHSRSTHVFHQYTLQVNGLSRDALKKFLADRGVSTMIYYPYPIHLQKAYQYLGKKRGDFPVAESLCDKVLSLPMHTELEEEQLKYITKAVLSCINEKNIEPAKLL